MTRVTALGGGHGLYSSLSALRNFTDNLTAIVTVADDGGSSGRLRAELGVPPPGDLRMALSALCEDTEWGRTWRDVLQHRFDTDGPLNGHALGNLLIAGLWSRTGGIVEGLDWVGQLLRSVGRVLPLSEQPLVIEADIVDNGRTQTVIGQFAVATARGSVGNVRLLPRAARVPAATISAIDEADVVVLGPGSWYSSVMPHFLLPEVRDALIRANDRAIITLNIAHVDDESAGDSRALDIAALQDVVPDFRPAAVVSDASHQHDDGLQEAHEVWGAGLVVQSLRKEGTVDRHDPHALHEALSRAASEYL